MGFHRPQQAARLARLQVRRRSALRPRVQGIDLPALLRGKALDHPLDALQRLAKSMGFEVHASLHPADGPPATTELLLLRTSMLSAIGMHRKNPRPVLAASPNPTASDNDFARQPGGKASAVVTG